MRDPITVLHEALEDVVEQDEGLLGLVRPGGRCRFVRKTGEIDRRDRDPRPHVVNESNSPTLMLSLSAASFLDHRDNMTGEIEVTFVWQISSSQHLLDMATYPVMVALFVAVRRALPSLMALTMPCRLPNEGEDPGVVPHRQFVEDVEIAGAVADQPMVGMNYRTPVVEGWQTIMEVQARIAW